MAEQTTPTPRSRGAVMAALRRKEIKQVGSASPQDVRTLEPPKPRGRAALLNQLRKHTESVGKVPDPVVEPAKEEEYVAEAVSELSLEEPVTYRGESGRPTNIAVNYLPLHCDGDRGVYEYNLVFNPEVDARNKRYKLVNDIVRDQLKCARVFDEGSTLFLSQQVTGNVRTFSSSLDGTDYAVTFKFIKKKQLYDRDCIRIFNMLFKRIMKILLYKQMGKCYVNPENKFMIPQHQLEVLPGYVVTVDQQEGGLLLCLDTQHRVLRNQNALDLLMKLRGGDPAQYKETVGSAIIGTSVFTRYNNLTYRIDDIAWDTTPKDTFETRDGGVISFIEYYKSQHGLEIHSDSQPMLIHHQKVTVNRVKEERLICLVPELCYLTGLTDEMRNDFRIMKDVAQYTIVTPQQRRSSMMKYVDQLRASEEALQVLRDWGLELPKEDVQIPGRELSNEVILFGGERSVTTNESVDWSRAAGENRLTLPVDLFHWVLFYTGRDEENAKQFAQMVCKLGNVMGCKIAAPKPVLVAQDRTDNYVTLVKQHVVEGVQMAVFIVPTIRVDRYSTIKHTCCAVHPVPSQVVTSKVLSNPKRVRSIVQKIALQMIVKLGGTLWEVKLPFHGWMVLGMDVYHKTPGSSACGLVGSLNSTLTRYMTLVNFQQKELGDFLKLSFARMLQRYKEENSCFPVKVIFYRDGVSDGQIDHVKQYEISQFESVLKEFQLDTKITFIVVQKRINTRLYRAGAREYTNPVPGTVVDHTVTKSTMKDFFLVSQSVRQGTVNPTHYIVVRDDNNLKPDIIQRLTYKMCHLYYNWAGCIRVPAPCQYAHKAAGLVGQFVKKTPDNSLVDKLYYL